jgi:uncharacterized protein YbbK (DUF523 family)
MDALPRPRLGISACLLGRPVRYDGGHKRDAFLADALGPLVEWVPVCPEVEVGMPVPRPTLRLSGPVEAPRLVAERSGEDWSARMQAFAEGRVTALLALELSGFVLKSGSPSCGQALVPVHGPGGTPSRGGTGAFARVLLERLPHLPVEEEGRLQDPLLRRRFLERVFAQARRQAQERGDVPPGQLAALQAAHQAALQGLLRWSRPPEATAPGAGP